MGLRQSQHVAETETQKMLGGLSAPDRMIEHLPHLIGEGEVVGADRRTAS